MKSEISASEASRRFSEIVNRVRYRDETFVVKRAGVPVCEIAPVRPAGIAAREFVELLRSLPHPDREFLDAVESAVRQQPKAERLRWRH